jgi:hypothetical protein
VPVIEVLKVDDYEVKAASSSGRFEKEDSSAAKCSPDELGAEEERTSSDDEAKSAREKPNNEDEP